jgi:hypothetical protein
MDQYVQDYTIWQRRPEGDSSPQPPAPDARVWVATYGVEVGETGLVDYYSVANTPLGKTSAFENFMFRPFRDVGFDPDVPLYRLRQIRDANDIQIEYLYWKIATQSEYVPNFEEARQEVLTAWQRKEARKLARQKAEQLRDEAAAKEGSLAERLGQEASRVLTPPAFSWLSMSPALGILGMQSPQLSDIEGIEGESWELMRTIFSTAVNELGIAANAPEDHYYVFQVLERDPPENVLQERFLQTFHTGGGEFRMLANARIQTYFRTWFSDLRREMAVEWKRPPHQPGE